MELPFNWKKAEKWQLGFADARMAYIFFLVQAFSCKTTSAPAAVLKVIAHSVSCEVSHGIVVDKRSLTKQRWC